MTTIAKAHRRLFSLYQGQEQQNLLNRIMGNELACCFLTKVDRRGSTPLFSDARELVLQKDLKTSRLGNKQCFDHASPSLAGSPCWQQESLGTLPHALHSRGHHREGLGTARINAPLSVGCQSALCADYR